MMVASLSADRRIQRQLIGFREKLPGFIEYLKKKDLDYLRQIKIPTFEGSLLLNTKN